MSCPIFQTSSLPSSGIRVSLDRFNFVVKETANALKETAKCVWEVIKKVAAFVLSIGLVVIFPGYFTWGALAGVSVGIISSTKFLKDSLKVIAKIWERQSIILTAAIAFMFFLGQPHTSCIASFFIGMNIGVDEALNAKESLGINT